MTVETSYSNARANLADLWDRVVDDRETIIVHRRGRDDIAIIAADELNGLLETVYLLRSPANAKRLLTALARVQRHEGQPRSISAVAEEFGLSDA